LLLLLLPLFGGCTPALNPFISRGEHADRLAAGWQKLGFRTQHFDLMGYARIAQPESPDIAVFIEGDGLAYLGRSEISPDPTPERPTALELAVRHPTPNVLYLARPCQYGPDPTRRRGCDPVYWTIGRFAPEAVSAMNQAVDQFVVARRFSRLSLYGYSGGGTMAALLAARRKDVVALVTVAGVLDHQAWTSHFGDAPLRLSLNPTDFVAQLRSLPQRHFVGQRDDTVPALVAQSYLRRARLGDAALTLVPRADHTCCWADLWSELARQAPIPAP
jgi:pimeloyl-ACP methyl ester carboxylesterase